MVRRIGLIGFGAIGQSIAAHLQQARTSDIQLAAVCVRPGKSENVPRSLPAGAIVTHSIEQMLRCRPDVVVEAAGQNAVVQSAEEVLRAGLDLFVLSLGALADPALRERLISAASLGRGGICIPAGALAGFDGLLSLRKAGLKSVTYTSIKPPRAWRGTPADHVFDLDALQERTVVFQGNAAEAALNYPKNANLAAAVALAGIGFEATRVELIADPRATGNTGTVTALGEMATLDLSVSSTSLGDNPKTSAITGLSVLAAIENRSAALRFV